MKKWNKHLTIEEDNGYEIKRMFMTNEGPVIKSFFVYPFIEATAYYIYIEGSNPTRYNILGDPPSLEMELEDVSVAMGCTFDENGEVSNEDLTAEEYDNIYKDMELRIERYAWENRGE